ncbi:molybdopterin cofactor-binding domain-containing protein, partial [Streptomyces caeruleatus]
LQDAVAEGAPQLYDEAPGNVALDFLFGDPAAVDAAFAQAAHVTAIDLVNNRVVVNPMEPRAAIGEWDEGAQRWILRAPTQGV